MYTALPYNPKLTGERMNKVNEASPASETSDVERVVMRLQHQYITRNDGRGRNGLCRVSSGDLLDLLHYVEKMTAHPPSRHCMCELCRTRGKTWNGGEPTCAFSGSFSDNWNCATVNAVRDICYEGQELKHGIDYQYCEDDKYATIKVDHLDIDGRPLALWVSWYKSRGSTQAMWLLFDKLPPRIPTEAECLAIVSAYT